jgi:hypothetical protein
MENCHGEAARSVLAKVRGDIVACLHAVAAKVTVGTGIHSLAFRTGASRYHNCYIDGGTIPEYFGYHLILAESIFYLYYVYLFKQT